MEMPLVRSLMGKTPIIGKETWIAPTAQIIGDVSIGSGCSIWYQTVLRGDVGPIRIGDQTNIQDGTIIHGTFQKAFATIGNKVTVGHGVILHGCRVDDLCLIGMGAILMDNVHVGAKNIVGAGSLLTENFECLEEGWLIIGRPAKKVRRLTEKEMSFLEQSAKNYLMYKKWYEE